jgi:PST family polysaccharide transporter
MAWLQLAYAIQILIGAWFGQHFGITGVSVFIVAGLIAQFCLLSYICNRKLSMKWREFLMALSPGFACMLILGSLALLVATIARSFELTNLLTLILCLSSIMLTTVIALLAVPNRLGEDLIWWLKTMQQYVPSKLRVFKPSRTLDRELSLCSGPFLQLIIINR